MDERTATAAPPSTQLDLVRMQHLVAVEAIHTELARIVKYLVGGGAGRGGGDFLMRFEVKNFTEKNTRPLLGVPSLQYSRSHFEVF